MGYSCYSLEDVRKILAEKKNYTLLSTEYINSDQKLDIICDVGHRTKVTLGSIQSGRGCPECGRISRAKTRTIPFSKISETITNEGYEVLTKESEYKDTRTKIHVKCKNGHFTYLSYLDFKGGHGCKFCGRDRVKQSLKLSYDFVKSSFEERGYKLLSTEYINFSQKLDFICPNGHIGKITYASFRINRGCKKCGRIVCGNKRKKDKNDIESFITSIGYKILDFNYINSKSKMFLECQKGHQFHMRWNDLQQGIRCPSCFTARSYTEIDIFNFVKNFCPDTIQGDYIIASPYELDIVVPSKKLAIEYCGLYWHGENGAKKHRDYHRNKLRLCNIKGYNLITIFEDEWLYRKDIVESILKNRLGVSQNIVFARKCNIQEIEASEAREFCKQNHIQGYAESSIKLGAFYNYRLVSVMTFSKPSIAKNTSKDVDYELSRFCSLLDTNVIGIASKFMSYFLKKYNCNSMISFSDNRWFNGNLYPKIGFNKEYVTDPNYWYFKSPDKTRIHRFSFRKDLLSSKLSKFDVNLSEWENMKVNGYDRIWDCGNIKWVWKKNESN